MSGLPADFDPLSPSMDHLSMIDEASKGRSQPQVTHPIFIFRASACGLPMSLQLLMSQFSRVQFSCHAVALFGACIASSRRSSFHSSLSCCRNSLAAALVQVFCRRSSHSCCHNSLRSKLLSQFSRSSYRGRCLRSCPSSVVAALGMALVEALLSQLLSQVLSQFLSHVLLSQLMLVSPLRQSPLAPNSLLHHGLYELRGAHATTPRKNSARHQGRRTPLWKLSHLRQILLIMI